VLGVIRRIRETKPRIIYLNSLFDYSFAILPLLVAHALHSDVPVVLAPRGELSTGALRLKKLKKRIFIIVFRLFMLHKVVIWHASTDHEKTDIQRIFGRKITICIAIDLRANLSYAPDRDLKTRRDEGGGRGEKCADLIFFSRIVPKKNTAAVIRAVSHVKERVSLSIAGPIEDLKYWSECLDLIQSLPEPCAVRYVGTISPEDVVVFLGNFDLFVLPTWGENFGHAILEALAAGTPVIVGNDTPWGLIETRGAGWLCDPANPKVIAELIDRFLSLNESERQDMRTVARGLAREIANDPGGVWANRSMFRALASGGVER
jgi:glycosyltransferase involved in cell wall biosynthesis